MLDRLRERETEMMNNIFEKACNIGAKKILRDNKKKAKSWISRKARGVIEQRVIIKKTLE